MPLFGVYGRHEISMCPLNRKESAMYTNKFFNTDFSEILPKYKINKIVAQYHSGFEHTFLWVFDAEDGHAIQEFAMDYGMAEWNELKIVPLVEFKDSVAASRKKWNIQDDSTL